MATYVLVHGASNDSWYWHLVIPDLEALGHRVVAPDMPSDDDAAGLPEYAGAVVDAVGDGSDVVVVAQSLGGFVVPLVCDRIPVRLVVLVAAMVPLAGESPGEWWDHTGWEEARREHAARDGRRFDGGIDVMDDFFHDVPPEVLTEVLSRGERRQSMTVFERPFPMPPWPEVPTRFLLCRDDRFFPAEFVRRVVRDRLGIVPDEIDSGHLPALSHPQELADRLASYGATSA